MRLCDVDGCGRTHEALGLCNTHYTRLRRTGKLGGPVGNRGQQPGRPSNHRRQSVGYQAVHRRLKFERGEASQFDCGQPLCTKQAREWAYDHGDPNEQCDGGLSYSLKLEHYLPLCVACHRRFDLLAAS